MRDCITQCRRFGNKLEACQHSTQVRIQQVAATISCTWGTNQHSCAPGQRACECSTHVQHAAHQDQLLGLMAAKLLLQRAVGLVGLRMPPQLWKRRQLGFKLWEAFAQLAGGVANVTAGHNLRIKHRMDV